MIKINSPKITTELKENENEKKNHIFKNNTQLYREKCQTINWIITDIKITAALSDTHKPVSSLLKFNRLRRIKKRTEKLKLNPKGLTQPSTVESASSTISSV